MDEDIMCLLTHLMGKLTQIEAKNSQKFANTFKASPQCLGGEVHRHQLNGILRRWRESGWVSLKTQFCHFLFSKANVFVPFYMEWQWNLTDNFDFWMCREPIHSGPRERRGNWRQKKVPIPLYLYIVKALQRWIQKLTSLLPIQKCLPVSLCFFLLLPILAPVSCIC